MEQPRSQDQKRIAPSRSSRHALRDPTTRPPHDITASHPSTIKPHQDPEGRHSPRTASLPMTCPQPRASLRLAEPSFRHTSLPLSALPVVAWRGEAAVIGRDTKRRVRLRACWWEAWHHCVWQARHDGDGFLGRALITWACHSSVQGSGVSSTSSSCLYISPSAPPQSTQLCIQSRLETSRLVREKKQHINKTPKLQNTKH